MSEEFQELLSAYAGRFDDLSERSLGEITGVHRYDDAMAVFGMPEDLMASFDTIEFPTAPLQDTDRLARRHASEPRTHAPTVTRSISIGPGIGSPCASRDSRYPSIASRIMSSASSRVAP